MNHAPKKFRAYSRKWNLLIDEKDQSDYSIDIHVDGTCTMWHGSADDENAILMQYTGMNDREGNMLYEGDEILTPNNNKYVIEDVFNFHYWCSSNSIDPHLSCKLIRNMYVKTK